LLTSAEIKKYRKQFGWSQQDLSKKTGLGISSIKRWELGIIQTKPMDTLLKQAFRGEKAGSIYTGNRKFSLERIKLVMKAFERKLRVRLLEDGDMLLHDAKYVWYADMVAYRELGRGMTGAAYGALPYGPQLNNYRDLVESIRNADETSAEPLTDDEKKIITKIPKKFATKQMVYDASHREPAWISKAIGSIIPYSDSQELQEI
jgi:transcriptional regulator with XRE-family HTH domain